MLLHLSSGFGKKVAWKLLVTANLQDSSHPRTFARRLLGTPKFCRLHYETSSCKQHLEPCQSATEDF